MPPKKRTLLSGFCANGQHEGLKPKNWRGDPMPTCNFGPCTCKCHTTMDEMFKAADLPRVPIDNPEYHPDHGDFVLPAALDVTVPDGLLDDSGTEGHDNPSSPSRAIPDPVAGVSFVPTESGRRARGQLEYEVLAVCRRWLEDEFDWPACYPKFMAEMIDKADPPSTGAITAVFQRWERMDFAEYQHKPIAFLKFINSNGTAAELTQAKAVYKRSIKNARSRARRGIR